MPKSRSRFPRSQPGTETPREREAGGFTGVLRSRRLTFPKCPGTQETLINSAFPRSRNSPLRGDASSGSTPHGEPIERRKQTTATMVDIKGVLGVSPPAKIPAIGAPSTGWRPPDGAAIASHAPSASVARSRAMTCCPQILALGCGGVKRRDTRWGRSVFLPPVI
jgi:hypothetical protein